MKLHLLSDLHLEFSAFEPTATTADVVVLAGDIALGARGVTWARQAWPDKEIVYVPGNHEYYHSEIEIERECLALAAQAAGVHLLNPGEVVIQGVRFLGCTLWTDFRLFGEAERPWAHQAGLQGLTDFRVIDYGDHTLLPQETAAFHAQEVAWLAQKLRTPFDGATVVVTHHLPAWASVSARYQKSLLSACFASRLEHLLGNSQLWLHGHTHDSFDYTLNGTRVVCNPRGYCRSGYTPENQEFNPNLLIEIV